KLRRDEQLALARQPAADCRKQPAPNRFGKTGTVRRGPAKHDLRVHLVDVLAPRSPGARDFDAELVKRDRDSVVDPEHGEPRFACATLQMRAGAARVIAAILASDNWHDTRFRAGLI